MIRATIAALALAAAATTATTQTGGSIAVPADRFDEPLPPPSDPAARIEALNDYFGMALVVPLTIDFEGGSLGEYVEVLHEAMGVDFVVVMPGAESIPVPPVRLTQVSAADALRIFQRGVQGAAVSVDFTDSGTAIVSTIRRQGPGSQLFTLSLATPPGSGLELEEVIAAVEAAAAFVEDPTLRLSVHEDTELLFIEGGPEAISMVVDTVDRVFDTARTRGDGVDPAALANEVMQLNDANGELMDEAAALRNLVKNWQVANAELEGRAGRSGAEADELRSRLAEFEAAKELELTRVRLEAEAQSVRTEVRLEESLRMNDELRARVADAERALAELQRVLRATEDELARLRAERQGGGGGSSR